MASTIHASWAENWPWDSHRIQVTDRLVTCHQDLHPDNVLVEATGEPAVLDWDDAGPACPGR